MRLKSLGITLLLCSWMGVISIQAAAQPQTSPKIEPDTNKTARFHFKNGKIAFKAALFSKALIEYKKAYKLLPLAGFLFNIGQCHRNLNQYQKAIDSYAEYIRQTPNAKNKSAVENLLRKLKKLVKKATQKHRKSNKQLLNTSPKTNYTILSSN